MTLSELATLALAVLDAQQKYFKSRGTASATANLIESKRLEKELRDKATEALRG